MEKEIGPLYAVGTGLSLCFEYFTRKLFGMKILRSASQAKSFALKILREKGTGVGVG